MLALNKTVKSLYDCADHQSKKWAPCLPYCLVDQFPLTNAYRLRNKHHEMAEEKIENHNFSFHVERLCQKFFLNKHQDKTTKALSFILCCELFLLNDMDLSNETIEQIEKTRDFFFLKLSENQAFDKNELHHEIKDLCYLNHYTEKEIFLRNLILMITSFHFDTSFGVVYDNITEYVFCDSQPTPYNQHCNTHPSKIIPSIFYSALVGISATGAFIDFFIDDFIQERLNHSLNKHYRDIIDSQHLQQSKLFLTPHMDKGGNPYSKKDLAFFGLFELASDALPVMAPQLSLVTTKDFLPNFALNGSISIGIFISLKILFMLGETFVSRIQQCCWQWNHNVERFSVETLSSHEEPLLEEDTLEA
jgi:hypothetical protein